MIDDVVVEKSGICSGTDDKARIDWEVGRILVSEAVQASWDALGGVDDRIFE